MAKYSKDKIEGALKAKGYVFFEDAANRFVREELGLLQDQLSTRQKFLLPLKKLPTIANLTWIGLLVFPWCLMD